MIPRLALTPGEPAGVGPDLLIQTVQQQQQAQLIAFADPHMLAERAQQLGLPCEHFAQTSHVPRCSRRREEG